MLYRTYVGYVYNVPIIQGDSISPLPPLRDMRNPPGIAISRPILLFYMRVPIFENAF